MKGWDCGFAADGTGEASNPSWHPNGLLLAFAWTRGNAARPQVHGGAGPDCGNSPPKV